ncbi:PhzF family phenazine biosynthesis protein [Bauldia sp.]|uniref:PhzF family phenazine biosynthesis protein n=1 Tax=Bauldia sp. TaxID=2575872 RepID=UPI003BAB88F8
MTRSFAILDVFTDTALSGNPLAVVEDGTGLSTARMQAIAGEFNLSETVFVLPPQNPIHAAAIRIFTPKVELPFAGHPTVGTAVLLALAKRASGVDDRSMMFVMEEKVGPVRCGVTLRDAEIGHCTFDLPKLPTATDLPADQDRLAAALDLTSAEIGMENHLPSAFDAGVPYCFVPVRDQATVDRARLRLDLCEALFPADNMPCFYVYAREATAADHHFYARMLAPFSGIDEDPATGSAVAALAGVIARFDQPPGGSHRYTVEQGYLMGRPSLIGLEIDMNDGGVEAARLSGDAVVVARGILSL